MSIMLPLLCYSRSLVPIFVFLTFGFLTLDRAGLSESKALDLETFAYIKFVSYLDEDIELEDGYSHVCTGLLQTH